MTLNQDYLRTARRVCKIVFWSSLIAAITLALVVWGYHLWQLLHTGHGVSREMMERTAGAMTILNCLSAVAVFIKCMLPKPKLLDSNSIPLPSPSPFSIQKAYQWAMRQAQIIGVLFSFSGCLVRFDTTLSLLTLIGVCVLTRRYVRHPSRLLLKQADPYLKRSTQACICISLQLMFMFAMSLVLCCASVALNGVAGMLNEGGLYFLAIFGCAAFGIQFYIHRQLDGTEIAL